MRSGERKLIAPWQITDPEIFRPDWPRTDLNLACLELLIGLVFMADPPKDVRDWKARKAPDADRLRDKLANFVPAFNLLGDGPLFLQDLEPLDGTPSPIDMLFIDSAGANTAKNNADLMVHRDRYVGLDLPTAAMALFTFQAHAPAGGAGNRTSMRGGGPLVTLIDPMGSLWDLVWANVPYGEAAQVNDLPWMRRTRISDNDLETFPPAGKSFSVEAFFGMPRRLRLVSAEGVVTGAVQKPWGTKYAVWRHPLTPYYRKKAGELAFPVHPRAGTFGYRHWLGILAVATDQELAERAFCIEEAEVRGIDADRVIVAGWAMDNMKPLDFTYSVQPYVQLSADNFVVLAGLVTAAEQAAVSLRGALKPLFAEGEAREAQREAFFAETEAAFLECFNQLKSGTATLEICNHWLRVLRTQALKQFENVALKGLDQRDTKSIQEIVSSHRSLMATFAGYGKVGKAIFEALMMVPPASKGKAA